jgi:hypothetical protein
MQIVRHTLILALRDDTDVDNFIDKLENHITELFFPETIYNMSLFYDRDIKKIDFPDPANCTVEEIDKWTEKSTEVIDEEISIDTEPVFKNPYGN